MSATSDFDRYEMLYCDRAGCRVNTFERGLNGKCPGCDAKGEPVEQGR